MLRGAIETRNRIAAGLMNELFRTKMTSEAKAVLSPKA